MFSRIRRRVTYTNIVLTFALLFAMTGGAYAAKHYVITSVGQISPKVLKALQGKAGAPGPAGASGSAGAKGDSGAAGSAGAVGERGSAGAPGSPGAEGPEGPEGSPWTAGGTLPPGASEDGVWAAGGLAVAGIKGVARAPISFDIPLKSAPAAHLIEPGEAPPVGCKGSAAKPEADKGNLCIFVASRINVAQFIIAAPGGEETSTIGTMVGMFPSGEEGASGNGTWAVTGGE
jgi:hypothetical protein